VRSWVASALAFVAGAELMRLDVRVIGEGAKFPGASMDGVAITPHEADTGALVLALLRRFATAAAPGLP